MIAAKALFYFLLLGVCAAAVDRQTNKRSLGAWLRRNIARNDSATGVPHCTAQQEERECACGDTARSRYKKKVAENCPWRTRDVSADGVCLADGHT